MSKHIVYFIGAGEEFESEGEARRTVEAARVELETTGDVIRKKKATGVNYDKSRNKWRATISNNGKRRFLGNFDSEWEARQVVGCDSGSGRRKARPGPRPRAERNPEGEKRAQGGRA